MARVFGVNRKRDKLVAFLKDKALGKLVSGEIGEFSVERIYRSTKTGKSLATETSLKTLKEGTIKRRKAYKGSTGEFFKPAKSNLTFSGQLLNALTFRVIRNGVIEVFVKDNMRTPYKGEKSSSTSFNRDTNADIARKVAEDGRPFIGMDKKGVEVIKQIVLRNLRKQLRSRSGKV